MKTIERFLHHCLKEMRTSSHLFLVFYLLFFSYGLIFYFFILSAFLHFSLVFFSQKVSSLGYIKFSKLLELLPTKKYLTKEYFITVYRIYIIDIDSIGLQLIIAV